MELGKKRIYGIWSDLETDSEMEMWMQKFCQGMNWGTERPHMTLLGSRELHGPSEIVPHIEVRGQAFVPLAPTSPGRREGNIEEGSPLQPKAMPREGHSCEPSTTNTPSGTG